MPNTFHVARFRSSQNLAYPIYFFLGLQIIALAIGVFSALGYLISPDWSLDLDDGSSEPVFFLILGLSALLRIAALAFTVVFFLIWEFRAYSNLSPLKARNLEFSPGWAVGWWFIPFANFVKPYQAVQDLWLQSDPEYNEDLGFLPSDTSSNGLFGFWWGTFIVGNILLRISDNALDNDSNLRIGAYLYLLGGLSLSVSAVLLFTIVKDTTRRQLARNARLETSGFREMGPPPPPSFV
jgi:hypothetical protein